MSFYTGEGPSTIEIKTKGIILEGKKVNDQTWFFWKPTNFEDLSRINFKLCVYEKYNENGMELTNDIAM